MEEGAEGDEGGVVGDVRAGWGRRGEFRGRWFACVRGGKRHALLESGRGVVAGGAGLLVQLFLKL